MNFKKMNLLFLFGLITFIGTAQELKDGIIVGIVPVGPNNYAIINEVGTENYYKTAPYSAVPETFQPYENVQLLFSKNNTVRVEVISKFIINKLYATLINTNAIDLPPPTFNMPTLENGILFFDDEKHVHECYDLIQIYMDAGNYDMDERLDKIENQYIGYTSYRKRIINKYNWLNGYFSLKELRELYSEDFIYDEIYKTIINEYQEIGIGDSVYYFHDNATVLGVQKNNLKAIKAIREIGSVTNIYTSTSILNNYEITIIEGIYKKNELIVSATANPSGLYSYLYTINPKSKNFDCNIYEKKIQINFSWARKTELDDLYTTFPLNVMDNQTGGELTIDWGDGTTDVYQGHLGWEYVFHTYNSYGTYYPSISFKFTDNYGVQRVINDIASEENNLFKIEVGDLCTKNTKILPEIEKISNNNNWMLVSKAWTKNLFFIKQVGSYSHAYKNTNWGWALRNVNQLETTIDANYRNEACDFKKNKHGVKSRSDRKKVQKTKSRSFWHYYHNGSDIYSTHYMIKSQSTGAVLKDTIILNPC